MSQLDPVIHPPKRLQICALLSPVKELDFAFIRDHLEVSDSVLSKQLRYLEEAAYIKIRKETRKDGRQRTWVSLTTAGHHAFTTHVSALQKICS